MNTNKTDEIFKLRRADNGAEYLYISALDENYPVKTFFTSKNGGVSEQPYDSLNMGFATQDDPECVEENRRRVFTVIGKEAAECASEDGSENADVSNGITVVIRPVQVHKSDIVCINAADAEKIRNSSDYEKTFPDTDALITNAKNVILTTLHADCIPVYLYDPVHHAAGVAHAGWRGTRADIAVKTAMAMKEHFGSQPEQLVAAIGPGISYCCFETGQDVYDEFAEMTGCIDEFSHDDGNGKYHLDLKAINKFLLKRAGIENIYVTNYCTSCDEDLFYSYRRDGGITGRMCAGICLK